MVDLEGGVHLPPPAADSQSIASSQSAVNSSSSSSVNLDLIGSVNKPKILHRGNGSRISLAAFLLLIVHHQVKEQIIATILS